MRAPSLNASARGAAAPPASRCSRYHALTCSSDRKKLSVVQSEAETRRSSARRVPTHTIMPSAPMGPPASALSASGSPQ